MRKTKNFSKVKILVIGDLMLDRYWWGDVTRISPEAPVPVVQLKRKTFAVGGAANVAANIVGLGAEVFLVGLVGSDAEADQFSDALEKAKVSNKYLVSTENRQTIVKTRIIAHSQQVVRVDQETVKELNEREEELIFNQILKLLDEVNVVICSDYAKGLLTERLLKKIIESAKQRKISVLVDPKGKNYSKYIGSTLLTPNKKEAAEACNIERIETNWIETAGKKLIKDNDLEAILITRGEEGMSLYKKNGESTHFQASAREIYDVTGAGDTVIATLGVALGANEKIEDAVEIANIAAGLVVEQVGTTAINIKDLEKYLESKNT